MKTAELPSLRVSPEFRQEIEQVLGQGESLAQFVESAVRALAARRKDQAAFVARGAASLASARLSGEYVDADEVLLRLKAQLDSARGGPRPAAD